MAAIEFPLDRQGTLYVDGVIHSTGLFHADSNSGLYVSSLEHSLDVPSTGLVVLIPDDGENIDVERIYRGPAGEAHHHFVIDR